MVYYFDKASVGLNHLMFNYSMICVLRECFPNQSIVVIINEEQLLVIKEKLECVSVTNIEYRAIKIGLSSNGKWSGFKKLINKNREDLKFYKELLGFSKPADLIFCATASSISSLLFKKINARYPQVYSILTLHGEIETLYNAQSISEKIIASIYKWNFKIKAGNFEYLLLNKITKGFLVGDGFLKNDEILEISHPFVFRPAHEGKRKLSDTINLGHIGGLMPRKGSQFFVKLAEDINAGNNRGKRNIALYAIGKIDQKIAITSDTPLVRLDNETQTLISREMYDEYIEKMDFAVFTYPQDQYVHRVSGAVFDALDYNKPLIVTAHPYFKSLFEAAGDIGFYCNDYKEMLKLIEQLSGNDEILAKRYDQQIRNISIYKEKINFKNISNDLKSQIKRYHAI